MLRPPATSLQSFLSSNACRRIVSRPSALRTSPLPPTRPFHATSIASARIKKVNPTVRRKRLEKIARKRAMKPTREEALEMRQLRQEVESMELSLANLKKSEATEAVVRDLPPYTEEDFEGIYDALMQTSEYAREEEDQKALRAPSPFNDDYSAMYLVEGLSTRLVLSPPATPLVSSTDEQGAQSIPEPETAAEAPLYLSVVSRLQTMADQIAADMGADTAASGSGAGDSLRPTIPLGVASRAEWSALLASSVQARDTDTVPKIYDLMERFGQTVSDTLREEVVNAFANQGAVEEVERLTTAINKDRPTDNQLSQEFKIKALLRSNQLPAALSATHALEALNTPASLPTYTLLISALLSRRGAFSARDRALAWDVFAHMRFVAHPRPSAALYAVMIRACADGIEAEPERAMDLFTEMTVDYRIPPTTEAFNALILALARSKRTALEAFRVLQQMVEAYRDDPKSGLRPTRETYVALFESTKRMGDLARARWILAEMLKAAAEGEGGVRPDEEIMAAVFQTYAAYRVPYIRSQVPLRDSAADTVLEAGEERRDVLAVSGAEDALVEHPAAASHAFSPLLPQTHHEVMREASSLLERIVSETTASSSHADHLFRSVTLTPRLTNSYHSVVYAHSTLEAAIAEYARLRTELGVPVNAWTFLLALERCAYPRKGEGKREVALAFARRVFQEYLGWLRENARGLLAREVRPGELAIAVGGTGGEQGKGEPGPAAARLTERIWAAMIRVTTLSNELDESLSLVRVFLRRFPPRAVRAPPPPSPVIRSFQPSIKHVSLEKPDVDDAVPPVLMFKDFELLHHQLVVQGRGKDVAFLKWVAKVYGGALRVRVDGEEVRRRPVGGIPYLPEGNLRLRVMKS